VVLALKSRVFRRRQSLSSPRFQGRVVAATIAAVTQRLSREPESSVPRSAATPRLAVPKEWTRSIQAALVHVMSLAHYALVQTRAWAANSGNALA
jgi:hypothetical protein